MENKWEKAKQSFAEIGLICAKEFCWKSVLPSFRGKHFIFVYILLSIICCFILFKDQKECIYLANIMIPFIPTRRKTSKKMEYIVWYYFSYRFLKTVITMIIIHLHLHLEIMQISHHLHQWVFMIIPFHIPCLFPMEMEWQININLQLLHIIQLVSIIQLIQEEVVMIFLLLVRILNIQVIIHLLEHIWIH